MLNFDPATHTYTVGDEVLPSVTQILAMLTDLDSVAKRTIEYAAARGDAVHFACELFDRDDLDWDTVEAELVPYVRAWEKFRSQTGFVPDRIEHKMFHPALRFAGTLDRTGVLYDEPAIIDIKAVVAMYPATGPQLAAYEALLKASEPDCPAHKRYAVQLRKDGTYKLHPYQSRDDYAVFVSALTLWRFAHRHGQRIYFEPNQKRQAHDE